MNKVEKIARALARQAYTKAGNDKPDIIDGVIDRRWRQYEDQAEAVVSVLEETSLVAIVTRWADRIHNDRTLETVLQSIRGETDEIEEEIVLLRQGSPSGPDGVFGECVDVIASTLDMVREVRPDADIDDLEVEVARYLDKKCEKWARKYG